MAKTGWMIYGAYGYTGLLVAQEAMRRGHRPLLAGRSRDKLMPVAERLGLEAIAVDLSDQNTLQRALDTVALVFHAAGPFVETSDAMIRACIATATHYIDITGEIPVFRNTFSYDDAARSKKILLLSGAGFDVVPTDCMAAYVAERVPGAKELDIAIAGLSSISPGTLKSVFDGSLQGGYARRGGKLVSLPVGKEVRKIRFADRERRVMALPWGDLETAYRTTGIEDITTYMAFPPRLITAASATWPIVAMLTPVLRGVLGRPKIKRKIQRSIEARTQGPNENERRQGHSEVWVRASDREGRQAEAWLSTLEGYEFTAVAGVRIVEKTLAQRPVGASTPALAFGRDFVLEIDGTRRMDSLPAAAAE